MSGPYQPLVIRALLLSGGSISKRQLAEQLLLGDEARVRHSERLLMRWPVTTLTKHQVIAYDKATKTFRLVGSPPTGRDRDLVIKLCDERLASWNRPSALRRASQFYKAIEAAGGRCEACGVLAADRPLDVDHIVPRSRANNHGDVRTSNGESVNVDDTRNLQVLCEKCNRGKRDTSTFDFRPDLSRLAETIVLAEERSRRLGFDDAALWAAVVARRQSSTERGQPICSSPHG